MILKLLNLLIVIGFSFLSARFWNYCGFYSENGEEKAFVSRDKQTAVLFFVLAILFGLNLILRD